ncbi:MAG: A24 family peptidase [Lachnospiraceae bacterium]|nr:A24 family peptidase [Lachnospiraceae bacterium]
MSAWWVGLHLLLLSVEDLRSREVPLLPIVELALVGLCRAAAMGTWVSPLPGALLLCAGYLSDEQIGYGDGWLTLALGMWFPTERLLLMLALGSLLCVGAGLGTGERELPFVPFLTAAYFMTGGG